MMIKNVAKIEMSVTISNDRQEIENTTITFDIDIDEDRKLELARNMLRCELENILLGLDNRRLRERLLTD